MITREFQKGDAHSTAVYSDCEKYRYTLTRVWEPAGRKALFIMLNPSTATEVQNDPTVERCERRARTLGFGAFRVTNIFAWRDTDPRKMRAATDPVGPANDAAILESCPLGRSGYLRLGHPWRAFVTRARGRASSSADQSADISLGPDQRWAPEASAVHRLCPATRTLVLSPYPRQKCSRAARHRCRARSRPGHPAGWQPPARPQ